MADGWSIKEKLYLACSVVKNGENWVSVSKMMRNMTDNIRTTEYFSQKNCAQQYSALVEALSMPRRRRSDMAPEPTASYLIEKLTQQRQEELKRIIQLEQVQLRKLMKEIEMIQKGQLDHQVPIMLEQRLMEKPTNITSRSTSSEGAAPESPMDTSASILESPTKSITEQEPVETKRAPRFAATPKTPESVAVLSPTRQPDIKAAISSPKTPLNQPDIRATIGSPKTPTITYQPSELVSPSRTPSLLVVRPSSPLVSPSMSPSGATLAIQGALLSPAKSISHSPPHTEENLNQQLQMLMQKLRSPSPTDTSSSKVDTSGATNLLKDIPETNPVVELEKLPASQVAAATGAALGDSDSDEEEKPLAKLKSPPPPASPAKAADAAAAAPAAVDRPTSVEKPSETIRSPPRVEPLKIRMDTIEKHMKEKAHPPKRILPARGKAAIVATPTAPPTSQRRKQNSGESNTSSEASSTIRTPATASSTSRSPLPVPAPFPDNETYRQWKKMILNVWGMAAGHRHASLFLQPVKDSIAPGYSKLVKRPVDLSTIKKNIENGTLTSTEQVRLELLMMFANAVMYNATNSEVNQMAREMADDVLKHLDELIVPINAMFSGGGVEQTKTLRSNRRPTAMATPTSEMVTRRSQVAKRPLQPEDDATEKPAAKRSK